MLNSLRFGLTLMLLTLVTSLQAHHGEMTDHVVNKLIYYGPAFLILMATAIWYVRKRRAGTES